MERLVGGGDGSFSCSSFTPTIKHVFVPSSLAFLSFHSPPFLSTGAPAWPGHPHCGSPTGRQHIRGRLDLSHGQQVCLCVSLFV